MLTKYLHSKLLLSSKLFLPVLVFMLCGIANSQSIKGQKVNIKSSVIDPRAERAFVKLAGSHFSCELESDWHAVEPNRAAYPKNCFFYDKYFPDLKFGFNEPWKWLLDLRMEQTEKGIALLSQGFRDVLGSRIPFMSTKRFFWNDPEMIYEVSDSRHVEKNRYVISTGGDSSLVKVSPDLEFASYTTRHPQTGNSKVSVIWQFSPKPSRAYFQKGTGWVFQFDSSHVETLISWSDKDSVPAWAFISISSELKKVNVSSSKNAKHSFFSSEKQKCIEPDESLILPDGEVFLTKIDSIKKGTAVLKNGLSDLNIRRIKSNKIELGSVELFTMTKLAESASIPDIKYFLVRSMRSLCERRVYNVVLEDDPGQDYIWGTGTWPRCFSISCLDIYDFTKEAYGYLEFMLDVSRQFEYKDTLPHLWDSFYMTGQRREVFTDINGHSIKLYEIGKFYARHRNDEWGKKLIADHYETIKQWCLWIEKHTEENGLINDLTESNVWDHGYGTFTQSPAAAGVKLFVQMAADAKKEEDVRHFNALTTKLLKGLKEHLYGEAANHYLKIDSGIGKCYVTYIPDTKLTTERPLGLSCYSLAANYFLQDPDVKLLDSKDEGLKSTLSLSMKLLSDDNDPRIITWHITRKIAHIGYGQGQLLMSLIYANDPENFRTRLLALFDASKKCTGDPYLLPELLGRPATPNRGNKAHLTYYPLIIAQLAGFTQSQGVMTSFIPDLKVKVR